MGALIVSGVMCNVTSCKGALDHIPVPIWTVKDRVRRHEATIVPIPSSRSVLHVRSAASVCLASASFRPYVPSEISSPDIIHGVSADIRGRQVLLSKSTSLSETKTPGEFRFQPTLFHD
ncbi:hypothetical protein BO70DRAFT_59036 [Aspergillus heteromorphus CBS 117.55]|uniref:Uncharacterized protein n=1 Tax=Aspergillus heteromorphus CBS 117.55 TaxID=1448321 RepID=A0A317W253_9EURO|nr:uncharacterized protein BO70DRAFT_59036 [Aspergillus heteromorphus CBS 117.55]PWY79327.1 hypothetical protein BO70DRAFT_59036 [Aspergillus heteromorphus CBS 117.55]